MAGMPSPSIVQPGSMSMMGYQGSGYVATPDILRKHQEEYSLKQTGQMVMSQALSATPGSYIGMSSKYNNSVVPVLPRLANPQGH
ncbi:hypothetical protein BGX34_003992 [Mortierella sp. NVP85]|nr:hypothetical protein BGX34_003992 [Mortierella sp. NVP85]